MIVLMINERQAVQIALGHELVHALRTMNGNRKRNETGSYLYYDNGYKVRQEELDTIGIDHIRQDGTYANASEKPDNGDDGCLVCMSCRY